ncbi:MAG TPA: hypothetical protein VH374_17785 [Polyangia bacterium]|jgi:predicted outer membrane repeat protein|nr:hypothetical protein [Polyangia bacterium]
MARHSLSFAGFAFALAVFVCGCKQGTGDRCEVNRDCQDGDFCSNITADNGGGICAPINTTPVDSGAPVDTGETDAGEDVSDAASAETDETDASSDSAFADTAEDAADTAEDASTDVPTEAAPAETAAD